MKIKFQTERIKAQSEMIEMFEAKLSNAQLLLQEDIKSRSHDA